MSRYKTKAEERADYLGYQRGYHAGVKKSVKHGWWEIDGHHRRCSECFMYFCIQDREGDLIPNRFCPNCGASMVNEDE